MSALEQVSVSSYLRIGISRTDFKILFELLDGIFVAERIIRVALLGGVSGAVASVRVEAAYGVGLNVRFMGGGRVSRENVHFYAFTLAMDVTCGVKPDFRAEILAEEDFAGVLDFLPGYVGEVDS